ncbi:hypothetical protein BC938DRAFT_482988 [Jimgerdemannia flammicorona]|uniref:Uncharacterized protein n=1 Tax=Jimgerdemannia flammicorona TaxID=994334 RepID=A0A433QCT2_9FUNG|nr:hypothetical protein BC938DRAFT_482988 [Jimgerdemannia flammicorona]
MVLRLHKSNNNINCYFSPSLLFIIPFELNTPGPGHEPEGLEQVITWATVTDDLQLHGWMHGCSLDIMAYYWSVDVDNFIND